MLPAHANLTNNHVMVILLFMQQLDIVESRESNQTNHNATQIQIRASPTTV